MAKFKVEDLIVHLSDKIDKNHEQSDKRLTSIELNLELHMKRSDTLEALYNHLKEKDIEPLQTFKARCEGGLKVLGVISLLLSIIGGFLKIFGVI